jgi:hypothetical protein
MPCIVALVVLSIMGIFSATNRALAKEALDCVLRRVTLRPCTTGFDEKIKAKVLGSVITRSEVAARVINKNFELISWIFFLVFLASGIFSLRGVYLFYTTGSCNGLNATAFCVFDPTGQNNQVSSVSSSCYLTPPTEKDLSLASADFSSFPVVNPTAVDKMIFIGCYACDYTREAYPMIRDLANKYNASLTYADFPTKEKTDYLSRVGYCANQQDPVKFWKLNDALFAGDKAKLEDTDYIGTLIANAELDTGKMNACISDPATETTVKGQLEEIKKTKFYGTPTIFINGTPMVGPKPYRVYAIELKGLLYWLQ